MSLALLVALSLSLPAGPAVPVQATAAFDGTWSGTGTLTQNRGRSNACGPDTTNRRLTIEGGRINFEYDTRYGLVFAGPIQADGTFDIASGARRFQGRASGSDMTATFTSSECVRSFQMRRRRN